MGALDEAIKQYDQHKLDQSLVNYAVNLFEHRFIHNWMILAILQLSMCVLLGLILWRVW